jgi:hypothetical protein
MVLSSRTGATSPHVLSAQSKSKLLTPGVKQMMVGLVPMSEDKKLHVQAKEDRNIMTLTRDIQTLTERPTIVRPPVSEGPFQGWGTRIG